MNWWAYFLCGMILGIWGAYNLLYIYPIEIINLKIIIAFLFGASLSIIGSALLLISFSRFMELKYKNAKKVNQ